MNELICLINNLTDSICSQEVTLANSILKLVVSMMLGAAVGWERKRKGQVAGVRTFALISMGACMAMLLSIYVPQEYLGLKNGDPGRIAAQVVTGVGFLGGGAMIQQKGAIRGLTTAAGIWMVATIGMAVGVGMYAASIFATCLILLTLVSFERWEHKRRIGQESKVINLRLHTIIDEVDDYKREFMASDIHLSTFYLEYDYDNKETEINFVVLVKRKTDYFSLFEKLRKLNPTKTITLSSEIDI